MTEHEFLDALVPDNLKLAMVTGNADKIAAAMTGMTRFEFGDVAQYVGTKLAERHQRYRTVARGLMALDALEG